MFHALLKNITVLDFSRLVPGAYCTKILVDLGARVIKIEDTRHPDYIHVLPPYLDRANHESLLGVYLNRNKDRLKLDLCSREGQSVIRRLIRRSHVLVHSYRAHSLKRFRLRAAQVHKVNPAIIYVTISGYGRRSRHAGHAGHDLNFMAASSLLDHFLPTVPSYLVADFIGGGLFGAFMTLAALLKKRRKRIVLNVAMTEALVYLGQHHYFGGGAVKFPEVTGILARYHLYKSKDKKWLALAALEDKFWLKFCDLLGLEREKHIGWDRKKNKTAIGRLEKIFSGRTSAYWEKFGLAHDVCLTVVSDRNALVREGYLRPGRIKLNHKAKKIYDAGFFGGRRRQVYKKSGADSEIILQSLGYSPARIKQFKQNSVISLS